MSIPVTLKCRIGIADHLHGENESYDHFADFVAEVTRDTGCHTVIVHARKAWLKGLSPKENREIPPLHYDYVYRLKQEMPHLEIILNGGINTLEETEQHLHHVDGVMMGREAYANPFLLSNVDQRLFGDQRETATRHEVCAAFMEYIRRKTRHDGERLHHLARHLLGLYHNVPGGRKFRRHLSENSYRDDAGVEVIEQALALIA